MVVKASENFLEIQILMLYPRTTEPGTLGVGIQQAVLHSTNPPRDSDTYSSLKTTSLEGEKLREIC